MRQWAGSLFLFTILGVLLFSCLIPPISLADISLQERRPAIPALKGLLEPRHYTMKGQLALRSMPTPNGQGACFSADDQRIVQHNEDTSASPAPSKIVCVSLIADSHETGWSG